MKTENIIAALRRWADYLEQIQKQGLCFESFSVGGYVEAAILQDDEVVANIRITKA